MGFLDSDSDSNDSSFDSSDDSSSSDHFKPKKAVTKPAGDAPAPASVAVSTPVPTPAPAPKPSVLGDSSDDSVFDSSDDSSSGIVVAKKKAPVPAPAALPSIKSNTWNDSSDDSDFDSDSDGSSSSGDKKTKPKDAGPASAPRKVIATASDSDGDSSDVSDSSDDSDFSNTSESGDDDDIDEASGGEKVATKETEPLATPAPPEPEPPTKVSSSKNDTSSSDDDESDLSDDSDKDESQDESSDSRIPPPTTAKETAAPEPVEALEKEKAPVIAESMPAVVKKESDDNSEENSGGDSDEEDWESNDSENDQESHEEASISSKAASTCDGKNSDISVSEATEPPVEDGNNKGGEDHSDASAKNNSDNPDGGDFTVEKKSEDWDVVSQSSARSEQNAVDDTIDGSEEDSAESDSSDSSSHSDESPPPPPPPPADTKGDSIDLAKEEGVEEEYLEESFLEDQDDDIVLVEVEDAYPKSNDDYIVVEEEITVEESDLSQGDSKPNNEYMVVEEEIILEDDPPQAVDQVIENFQAFMDEEPDDLEAAVLALIEVVHQDEQVDVESMLRRTRLKDLYKYLKQQYWYKLHTNKEEAREAAASVKHETMSEILTVDSMLKGRLESLVADVQQSRPERDLVKEEGHLDESERHESRIQRLMASVQLSSRSLAESENWASEEPSMLGRGIAGEEEEEDLLAATPRKHHVSKYYTKTVNEKINVANEKRQTTDPSALQPVQAVTKFAASYTSANTSPGSKKNNVGDNEGVPGHVAEQMNTSQAEASNDDIPDLTAYESFAPTKEAISSIPARAVAQDDESTSPAIVEPAPAPELKSSLLEDSDDDSGFISDSDDDESSPPTKEAPAATLPEDNDGAAPGAPASALEKISTMLDSSDDDSDIISDSDDESCALTNDAPASVPAVDHHEQSPGPAVGVPAPAAQKEHSFLDSSNNESDDISDSDDDESFTAAQKSPASAPAATLVEDNATPAPATEATAPEESIPCWTVQVMTQILYQILMMVMRALLQPRKPHQLLYLRTDGAAPEAPVSAPAKKSTMLDSSDDDSDIISDSDDDESSPPTKEAPAVTLPEGNDGADPVAETPSSTPAKNSIILDSSDDDSDVISDSDSDDESPAPTKESTLTATAVAQGESLISAPGVSALGAPNKPSYPDSSDDESGDISDSDDDESSVAAQESSDAAPAVDQDDESNPSLAEVESTPVSHTKASMLEDLDDDSDVISDSDESSVPTKEVEAVVQDNQTPVPVTEEPAPDMKLSMVEDSDGDSDVSSDRDDESSQQEDKGIANHSSYFDSSNSEGEDSHDWLEVDPSNASTSQKKSSLMDSSDESGSISSDENTATQQRHKATPTESSHFDSSHSEGEDSNDWEEVDGAEAPESSSKELGETRRKSEEEARLEPEETEKLAHSAKERARLAQAAIVVSGLRGEEKEAESKHSGGNVTAFLDSFSLGSHPSTLHLELPARLSNSDTARLVQVADILTGNSTVRTVSVVVPASISIEVLEHSNISKVFEAIGSLRSLAELSIESPNENVHSSIATSVVTAALRPIATRYAIEKEHRLISLCIQNVSFIDNDMDLVDFTDVLATIYEIPTLKNARVEVEFTSPGLAV